MHSDDTTDTTIDLIDLSDGIDNQTPLVFPSKELLKNHLSDTWDCNSEMAGSLPQTSVPRDGERSIQVASMVMLWVSDQLKDSRHGVTSQNPCSAVRKNWPSIGWSMGDFGNGDG